MSKLTKSSFFLLVVLLVQVSCRQEYSTCAEDDEECLAYEASINLFGSSWQMNPIIDVQEDNVKVYPVEIDSGSSVDMFVHKSQGQVQYIRNILGTGTSFNALNVTESEVYSFGAGDLNSDGHVDVATIDRDNQACWIHLNPLLSSSSAWRGIPFWESHKVFSLDDVATLSSRTYRMDSLLLEDFNSDGKTDILVVIDEIIADHTNGNIEKSSTLYVLFQGDDGEFSAEANIFDNTGIYPILAHNFDGDDKQLKDVLYLQDSHLHIAFNNDPVWSTQLIYTDATFSRDSLTFNILLADVNRDGYPDIVLPHNDNGQVGYLVNPSGSSEGSWEWVTIDEAEGDEIPQDIISVDVDEDGSTDFFTIQNGELKWYHQFKARTDIEDYFNHFNIFPINITPEEDRYNWNRLMVMPHTSGYKTRLIVIEKESCRVDWIRKRELALTGFGWDPNFWLYLMIYTIVVSLSVGTIHAYCLKKLERDPIGEKLIGKFGSTSQWDLQDIRLESIKKEIIKNQRNRTTSV
eukprot:CAMPEP_0115006250 /NCGR_PEP_ID=MMETSP0216-20121206/20382_1 /TAXON_ID=223996 /ORGANISM="Protocruzia adherens, Strain Boccale" /LENGTH=518 /DNA_ID=CAMNT_0002372785 /DNA_START=116 /DNA_END=1672 /DNA_ORIENTATION=-